MRTRLTDLWEALQSSLWFVPALMALAAAAVALAAEHVDLVLAAAGIHQLGMIYRGDPAGARALLSTVAGSMITVAGVAFSITVVALSLTSSQFGPRLLRNFMRDRGNKVVLGTFIATFVYCLIALRAVRGTGAEGFVPAVSVSLGLVLTGASLGVLVYFIHHVASSIQAESVVEAVGRDVEAAMDRIFPARGGPPAEVVEETDPVVEDAERRKREEGSRPGLASRTSGYIRAIDETRLVEIAAKEGLLLRLLRRPGHFVVEGEPLVEVVGSGEEMAADLADRIRGAFLLGGQRSQEQDPEYGIRQLVEVAVRALSPGINDPFTAIGCIDWLSSALTRIAGRPMLSPRRRDAQGRTRLLADPVTFAGILAAAFDQIRQCSQATPAVAIRILEALESIARGVRDDERREAIRDQAERVIRGIASAEPDLADQRDAERRHQRVLAALGRPPGDADVQEPPAGRPPGEALPSARP